MSKFLTDKELIEAAHGALFVTCEHLHKGRCTIYWLKALLHSLVFSLKFYIPLNILSMISRYKLLLKQPKETIIQALKLSLRSAAVLGAMVLFAKIAICSYVTTMNSGDSKAMLLASLVTIPASLIEKTGKISDLSMYVMPRFFDAFWKFLTRRNLVRSIPGFQVALFCMSMSAISYASYAESDIIKPMMSSWCKRILGDN